MKRSLKKGIVILLIFAMLFSFTGCDSLKKMIRNQGFWVDQPFGGKLEVHGATYLKADVEGYYGGNVTGYITTRDIPALLQNLYGMNYVMSEDEKIVTVSYSNVYIREDVFDEVYNELSNEKEVYLYSIYWNDSEAFTCDLSESETELLLSAIEKPDENERLQEEKFFAMINDESVMMEFFSTKENAYMKYDYNVLMYVYLCRTEEEDIYVMDTFNGYYRAAGEVEDLLKTLYVEPGV